MKKQQPDGPHAHRNTARQVVDDQNAEGSGRQRPRNDPRSNQHNPRSNQHNPRSNQHNPRSNQHNPGTPTTGLRQRENDSSRNVGGSGRQNAATRRSMRREERVTVQGPVKKQQPDGMSHRGVPAPLPMHPYPGRCVTGSPSPLQTTALGSVAHEACSPWQGAPWRTWGSRSGGPRPHSGWVGGKHGSRCLVLVEAGLRGNTGGLAGSVWSGECKRRIGMGSSVAPGPM